MKLVNRNELISYAMDFASYLISKVDFVNRIILYGSVARGDFDDKSDIDLFIDVDNEKLALKVQNLLDNYYKTSRIKEFKLKGINNQISIITSNLDNREWKNLKRAIINTGIILYGKYKAEVEKIYQYVLVSFENVKPERKRVAVFRKLFGFKLDKKQYPGLVDKIGGKRIGKGNIIVSIERANDLLNYLNTKKVNFKVYDLWADSEI